MNIEDSKSESQKENQGQNQSQDKSEHKEFCGTELRPLLVILVAVFLLTIGWVTYHEIKMKRDPVYAAQYHATIHHRGNTGGDTGAAKVAGVGGGNNQQPVPAQMQQGLAVAAAAGIPPIKLSDVVTHPNFGQDCEKCHEIIGPKARAPVNGGTIPITANMPHPFWGACKVCHTVVDAQGKPVAMRAVDPASILGIELTEATTLMTTKLDLPDKKGPIVSRVFPGGLAEDLGMQLGDMFYLVDARKIETVPELERAMGAFAAGDVVRVTVWRQRRQKIFRFSMPDVAAQVAAGAPNAQDLFNARGNNGVNALPVVQIDPNTAVADPAQDVNVIAIAATGKDVNTATVSNDLGLSPYFIVVNLKRNNYKIVQNAGGTGQQVVQDLMDLGAEAVICGYIGQGASNSLTNLGIKMYPGVSGDVKGAITAFKQGTLKEPNNTAGLQGAPDVPPAGPGLSGRRRTL